MGAWRFTGVVIFYRTPLPDPERSAGVMDVMIGDNPAHANHLCCVRDVRDDGAGAAR
jgi:hypothetical protein